ncbi:MAG: hypothetical protein H7039_06040 [Bryobacteraceae bacterium]|nr:hypothetical protein [Bryobacteraceae bacterium]
MKLVLLVLLTAVTLYAEKPAEPELSRAGRLTRINAKIAELERQIEYWDEEKRRLLDIPDVPKSVSRKRGVQVFTGPRNGRYYLSPSGRRVYESRAAKD